MRKSIIDVHTHTVVSGHAYSTFSENVSHALKSNMEILGISDHAPAMPGSVGMLHFTNFSVLPKEINGLQIIMGCELNIMDTKGTVDLPKSVIEKLDYTIASLHPPCIPVDTAQDYTQTLINTIKNPLINIIGHPGDPRYPFNIKEVVSCARDNNTVLELNNTSLNPNNGRAGGEKIIIDILKECKKQDFPIIIGSDAHYHTAIGDFSRAEKLLEETDFPFELVLNYNKDKFKEFINFVKGRKIL